jgi:RNA polymerase sigma-70 factor (ECF subfamily)
MRRMSADNAFLELIERMRRGEQAAAAELVRRYEPAIRRAVRLQMRDPRLRRVLDSVDVCQSVMASFFARAASGQYDLADPRQLSRLLLVMARNKLAAQARHPRVQRRELAPPRGALGDRVDPGPSASELVDWLDLFEAVRGHLSADELHLADRRAAGQDWVQIAAGLGTRPDAVRKKLARALERVGRELGLDGPNEG